MHSPFTWQDLAFKSFLFLVPLWVLVLGVLLLSGERQALRALRWMVGKRRAQTQFESLPMDGRRQLFLILGWGFVLFAAIFLVEMTRVVLRGR